MNDEQFSLLLAELRGIKDALRRPKPRVIYRHPKAPLPVRFCLHCGTEFQHRDRKAKFCCDQHRVSFNSLKRTPVPRTNGTTRP